LVAFKDRGQGRKGTYGKERREVGPFDRHMTITRACQVVCLAAPPRQTLIRLEFDGLVVENMVSFGGKAHESGSE
jgi:hypothetical protein